MDAFEVHKVINKTNVLLRELQYAVMDDFMGRTAKRDYWNQIKALWGSLNKKVQ